MLCRSTFLNPICALQFSRYGVAAGGEAFASSVTSAMEGVVVGLFLRLGLYHKYSIFKDETDRRCRV